MMLTETDASEAQAILTQASLSQRWQTRQNAIVAWGVLATAKTDRDLSEQAVRGMVKAAVVPVAEPSEQRRLMLSARDEIAALDESLRNHAFQTTLDAVQGGTVEGGNAARLAAILSEGQPANRQLGAWFSILGVRFVTMGRTWVEGVGVMATAAIAIAISIVVGSAALRLTSAFSKTIDEGGATTETSFVELLITAGLAVLTSGALTVPSATLRGAWSRLAEVLGQPLPILFFIGTAEITASNLNNQHTTLAFSMERLNAPTNLSSLAHWAVPLLVLWSGLSVARALSLRTTHRVTLLASARRVLSAGGWGTSAMLIATWALLFCGWQSDTVGTQFLPAWIGVVCASVAGVTLTDSRDSAQTPAASRSSWNARLWRFGGVLLASLIMGLAWWLVRQDDRRVEGAWQKVAAARNGGRLEMKCPVAPPHLTSHPVTLTEGQLYEVPRCQNSEEIAIRSYLDPKAVDTEPAPPDEPTTARSDGSIVIISQSTLFEIARDSPPILNAYFLNDPRSSQGYYVCATKSDTCPFRLKTQTDFATWMVQHLVRPVWTDDMLPNDSLHQMPPEPRQKFEFQVYEGIPYRR